MAESAVTVAKSPDEIVAAQIAAAQKSSADLKGAIDKAVAENKVLITDFAGTVGGVFNIRGVNLDKGGQPTLNGHVPEVTVTRSDVIKGKLRAPGVTWNAGPVVVKLGAVEFKGTL